MAVMIFKMHGTYHANWYSNFAPRYLSKGIEDLCPHKTCTEIHIAVLFIMTQTGKQPKFPSVGEWMNTLYISRHWNIIQRLKNELASRKKDMDET